MKKSVLFLMFFIPVLGCLAQIDSSAAFHTGEVTSNFLLDLVGVPTPVKLSVHTAAAFLFGWIWSKTHSKKKQK